MTGIHTVFTLDTVVRRILELRGQLIMLDLDLATLHGVETRHIPYVVKRNQGRFPPDFAFQLSAEEWANLKATFGTSNSSAQNMPSNAWGGRCPAPYAFTKHGALMLSSVLNSSWADEISLLIIRAFAWLRQAIPGHKELVATMAELENARQTLRLYSRLLSRQITNSTKLVFKSKK